MNNLSIFGSSGFIGSKFLELYPNNIPISRNDYSPKSQNILYFISTTSNYNVLTDPHLDINTNLNVLIDVLNNCRMGDTLNFISSWFVYGTTPGLPAYETDYCDPKGFYSITKRTAEQLLISYCETFGINYRILRLCNVIGKSDKGMSKQKNALQFLIEKLKNNEDIELYHDGYFLRDYMHVDDICSAIDLCVTKGTKNTIYNIGSGRGYIFRTLIDYCKEYLKSSSNLKAIEPSPFHKIVQVKDMWLDTRKLKKLGFQLNETIYRSLERIMDD
jgi:nucleoside-diphosphate-sugar epimerase